MAKLIRPEFEKCLVAAGIVPGRNAAKRCTSFISKNLTDSSPEAHVALLPALVDSGLAPSVTHAAQIIALSFEQWTGA